MIILKSVLLFLFLLFTFTLSVEKRWCHRELPSKEGSWRESAPFWQTEGCENQIYNQSAAYNCLKGRTVYVIGNSIARHYGFALYKLIGGEDIDRQQQKQNCLKNGLLWESCHQQLNDVKFKHLFLLYMDGFDYKDRAGFPYFRYESLNDQGNIVYDHNRSGHFSDAIGQKIFNSSAVLGNTPDDYMIGSKGTWKEIDDNCEGWNTRDCLSSFFANSTENDILIFSVGMMQVAAYNGQLVGMHVDPLDKKSWIISSAVNFKAHLAATFKGQVFRVTMAQANKNMNRHHWTESLREADDILQQLWTPSSVNIHDQWYAIDQWSINQNRDHLYDDNLHFPGPLADATVHQVLNELCPNQGDNKPILDWSNPSLNDTIIRITDADINTDNFYYISIYGYRHRVILAANKTIVPWYFTSKKVIDMNMSALSRLWLSPVDIPILYNDLVFRYQKDNQVWVVKDECKCRQRFHSGQAFMNRGFDFNNVKILPLFVMELLPVGDWLY